MKLPADQARTNWSEMKNLFVAGKDRTTFDKGMAFNQSIGVLNRMSDSSMVLKDRRAEVKRQPPQLGELEESLVVDGLLGSKYDNEDFSIVNDDSGVEAL